MDHLVTDIDGGAEFLQRTFDNFYGAVYASAKSAWARERNVHIRLDSPNVGLLSIMTLLVRRVHPIDLRAAMLFHPA